MLEVTQRLGGVNYVLWGGREGYDTLLNTDLRREGQQLARFLGLVAEHKAKIGFTGTLLIEPKPMEPTKHQYDFNSATVHGFLARHGLDGEYRLNIEANHATLAGHSFQHEVAYAVANGMFGSIDANRGDYQNGWDTDQFPNSVDELSLALYEILKGGGFTTGGFNFDAKLRRQSSDRTDLFHAHIGGLDTLARALLVAADMIEAGTLAGMVEARYAGWAGPLGTAILDGSLSLADLAGRWRRARSTRSRPPGTRSSSRASSTSTSGRSTAAAAADDQDDAVRRADGHGRGEVTMGHVLGIDASTTAVKAILLDELGAVLGIGSAGYDLSVSQPLWSEQDPRLWWDGTVAAIRAVLAETGVPADDVVAVGLTGQMHGAVLLDQADEVIRPAILWNDQRTGAECDLIRELVGPERLSPSWATTP